MMILFENTVAVDLPKELSGNIVLHKSNIVEDIKQFFNEDGSAKKAEYISNKELSEYGKLDIIKPMDRFKEKEFDTPPLPGLEDSGESNQMLIE